MRRPILLALALLAACTTERTADAPPAVPAAPAGPGVPLADLLAAPEAALGRLAPPLREAAEPVANRHVPGQTDTVRTLVYDGLEVEVYDVTGGGRLVQEVRLTGGDHRTAEGLGVGSPRAAVEAALGAPAGTEGDAAVYALTSGPDDPTETTLRVRYAGGRVAAMTWSFYVD